MSQEEVKKLLDAEEQYAGYRMYTRVGIIAYMWYVKMYYKWFGRRMAEHETGWIESVTEAVAGFVINFIDVTAYLPHIVKNVVENYKGCR